MSDAQNVLDNLMRRVADARAGLIHAKFMRPLSPEEITALEVLTALLEASTAVPMTGLLKMAQQVVAMDRLNGKIDRLLNSTRAAKNKRKS